MVLEALAAVGLASNIIQFIDFTHSLFSSTKAIYLSQAGSSRGSQELETVTNAIQQRCAEISAAYKSKAQQEALQNYGSIRAIASECEKTAIELQTVLQRLKARKAHSRWSSFKAALSTVWKEQEITTMEKKLDSYRQQIVLELTIFQCQDRKNVEDTLGQINGQTNSLNTMVSDLREMMTDEITRRESVWEVLDQLSAQSYVLGDGIKQEISDLRTDTMRALANLQSRASQSGPRLQRQLAEDSTLAREKDDLRVIETLGSWHERTSDIAVSMSILNDLAFPGMRHRHKSVSEAHSGSFEWLFKHKFASWLQSADPLFWISGKPGSGKSTLMKYLVDNQQLPDALQHWCDSKHLVVVDYFFWINGTDLQRSLEGLLRALLYDILRENHDAIKVVMPATWAEAKAHVNTAATPFSFEKESKWTTSFLLDTIRRLSEYQNDRTRFCIFIDGLDEFGGDHEDLVEIIRHLTEFGVKICIASRPWNVFEEAYGSDASRKLYLQDLNRPDIQRYVDDKLRAQPKFRLVGSLQAAEIIKEIVSRSQGVFLWVRLAVRSLIEGLRNRDSLALLRNRLHHFPSDLNEFFRHMFKSLDTIYQPHLSHMLQVALAADQSLSVVAYWYLDELHDDLEQPLIVPVDLTDPEDLEGMMEDMIVRINGRTKGLLEVTGISDPDSATASFGERAKVDFLHRTVKDFLLTTEMHSLLNDWQKPHFDAAVALCKSMLAEYELLTHNHWTKGQARNSTSSIEDFLMAAATLERKKGREVLPYVQKMERMATVKVRCSFESFVALTLKHGLLTFATSRMTEGALSDFDKERCIITVLKSEHFWNNDRAVAVDDNGLPKILSLVLSNGPAIRATSENLEEVGRRTERLPHDTTVSLIKLLCMHRFITPESSEHKRFWDMQYPHKPTTALPSYPSHSTASASLSEKSGQAYDAEISDFAPHHRGLPVPVMQIPLTPSGGLRSPIPPRTAPVLKAQRQPSALDRFKSLFTRRK
ncbi:hypothetical protein C7974DRAFT_85822 [Boeremia exigua]|uniref:uncharacterized protein n=1 Tax=Boeremia exigua TaxID=749465 RepID=UPI001E8D4B70|nr:uncharacterized protein C7974DRAFT_85822 [Boeremia exigua]KAH6611857.1 hypothetical protein C7974DRAFT_85822 [Boeremia exigua]